MERGSLAPPAIPGSQYLSRLRIVDHVLDPLPEPVHDLVVVDLREVAQLLGTGLAAQPARESCRRLRNQDVQRLGPAIMHGVFVGAEPEKVGLEVLPPD